MSDVEDESSAGVVFENGGGHANVIRSGRRAGRERGGAAFTTTTATTNETHTHREDAVRRDLDADNDDDEEHEMEPPQQPHSSAAQNRLSSSAATAADDDDDDDEEAEDGEGGRSAAVGVATGPTSAASSANRNKAAPKSGWGDMAGAAESPSKRVSATQPSNQSQQQQANSAAQHSDAPAFGRRRGTTLDKQSTASGIQKGAEQSLLTRTRTELHSTPLHSPSCTLSHSCCAVTHLAAPPVA